MEPVGSNGVVDETPQCSHTLQKQGVDCILRWRIVLTTSVPEPDDMPTAELQAMGGMMLYNVSCSILGGSRMLRATT